MNSPRPTVTAAPVRWPFRILAALIVLSGAVAVLGSAHAILQGDTGRASIYFLVTLPGAAWLLNCALPATIHGDGPKNALWPFASTGVFNCYLVVALYFIAGL